jgi:hypothetical protein
VAGAANYRTVGVWAAAEVLGQIPMALLAAGEGVDRGVWFHPRAATSCSTVTTIDVSASSSNILPTFASLTTKIVSPPRPVAAAAIHERSGDERQGPLRPAAIEVVGRSRRRSSR